MTGEVRAQARMGPVAVEIQAPAAMVDNLAGLVRPFVEVAALSDGPSSLPVVSVRRDPPDGQSWRCVTRASDYEPDRVLWVDDLRRHISVVGEPSAWRDLQLLRSVRHLLRWQAYARGDLLLHGGLVDVGGMGVAFLGGKRSGKTSCILGALLHGGADFISNDDVSVTDVGGELVGYGSPRSVNVRTDTLLALTGSAPAAVGLLFGGSHPTNSFEGRHRTAEAITMGSGMVLPGAVWVRPAELVRVTGCRLLSQGRIHAVVFPRLEISQEVPRMVAMTREAASRAMLANVEHEATKYDPFVGGWFPETDAARRGRLIERLLARASCYEITQDMNRLPEVTHRLVDTLRGQAGGVSSMRRPNVL